MDILSTFLPCFPISRKRAAISLPLEKGYPIEKPINYAAWPEKAQRYPLKKSSSSTISSEDAATSIVSAIQNAEKNSPALHANIGSIVHQAGGWSEYLAVHILSALETVLKAGKEMNGVLKEAYDKACEAAKAIKGFTEEHPIATAIFLTIIALGVLAILTPYVIEALGFWVGFGEEGPIAGSWAASWQSTYGAAVPARSLFSYFQRLGMTWGRATVM